MPKLNLIESFIVAGAIALSQFLFGISYFTLIPGGIAYLVICYFKTKKELTEKYPNAESASSSKNERPNRYMPAGQSSESTEDRLAKIEALKASGTITESEYRLKRSKILAEL